MKLIVGSLSWPSLTQTENLTGKSFKWALTKKIKLHNNVPYVVSKQIIQHASVHILTLNACSSTVASVDPKIDGVDQWKTISKGWPSARDEFVYNINEVTGSAAIR